MTANELKIRDYKVANFRRWLLEESAKIQAARTKARIIDKREINMLSGNTQDLTISRALGHKALMPGSGQWRLNKKLDASACWYCGNWSFALVFWN